MVKYSPESMNRTFAALADPTRRAIVARLAQGDCSVNDLAEPFMDAISLPAVSKHLRVLERAGLLSQEQDGRVRRCHLEPEPLRQVSGWVESYQRFWSHQLDALADYLENDTKPKTPPKKRKA